MAEWSNLLQYEEAYFHEKVNCLIIGSQTRNQGVLYELLLGFEAVCDVTTEFEKGLAMAKSGEYDIIFVGDQYWSEDSDSLQALYECGIPVIVLVGRLAVSRFEMQDKGYEYLVYPITKDKLLTVLRHHLASALKVRLVPRDTWNIALLYFTQRGLDVRGAMKYVADDFGQYIHLLKRFTDDEERKKLLKGAFANKDWGNYVTFVHALKNSARLVGAKDLADIAYEQEKRVKENHFEGVEAAHQAIIAEWDATVACIKDYLEHCDEQRSKGEVQIAGVLSEDVFRDKVEQVKKYLDTFQKKEALMLLRQLSAYRPDRQRLDMIEQAIIALERYDYDGVMQILQESCNMREGI